MSQLVLKNEIVDKIKNDGVLFGKVTDALKIKPVSLPYLLNCNHAKLTGASVIKVLREHLNTTDDSELLQEIPEEALAAK